MIDVHTHILPPPEQWPDLSERFGYAGWIALEAIHDGTGKCGCAKMLRVEQGPDGRAAVGADGKRATTFFREIGSNCWHAPARVAEMEAWERGHLAGAGPMVQVLSTVPVMFGYWARPEHTLELSRWTNDHIAGVCRERPRRFVGLGTIPMNAPQLAVKELERCVRDLGMAGVQIGSNINGKDLGEPEFAEVFAAAQELGACVFVHPWEMLCGPAPAHETGRAPKPPEMSVRLRKYWGAWLIGMPAETALAMHSVLSSGLLDRLPHLRIGFAHGGGSFPGTIGRIDHGAHARPDLCRTQTQVMPRERLRSGSRPGAFYVDSLVHDEGALRMLMDLIGPERIMLGSDYPFPLGEERPGELIRSMKGIDESARRSMLTGAATEFLGQVGRRIGAEAKA
ncbi:MAG TPA: amidohydrolase family protein [Phycisphaerales bacterium]|nr:amidohydrolase family protein [Phycisphaerales bacterium]